MIAHKVLSFESASRELNGFRMSSSSYSAPLEFDAEHHLAVIALARQSRFEWIAQNGRAQSQIELASSQTPDLHQMR